MNFNTLCPTCKLLKKLQSYAGGHPVTSGDVPSIAIINTCEVIESKKLVENIVCGIKTHEASVSVFNVPEFGYSNKINPMTAKFAESFRLISASNAEAIIRTNMADGVVIVTDCDITAAGLLLGCIKTNCPVTVLPLGQCTRVNTLKLLGSVTSGEITSLQCDEIIKNEEPPRNQSAFFRFLENIGLSTETAGTNKYNLGAQIVTARKTGEKIVSMAKNIITPKKLLTKSAYQNLVQFIVESKTDISALPVISQLFAENDVKTPHDFLAAVASKNKNSQIVLAKGTACGSGGYIQYDSSTPPLLSGKAWVYSSPEEADRAILNGSIPNKSVIVLHNCQGVNVTAAAYAIEGMGRAKEIALVTDGVAEKTSVLTLMLCTPNSLANEEFANIQNGDVLEIDITRGRFNTSTLAKDQKARAKHNTVKKLPRYF